jgi:hypothetical protein
MNYPRSQRFRIPSCHDVTSRRDPPCRCRFGSLACLLFCRSVHNRAGVKRAVSIRPNDCGVCAARSLDFRQTYVWVWLRASRSASTRRPRHGGEADVQLVTGWVCRVSNDCRSGRKICKMCFDPFDFRWSLRAAKFCKNRKIFRLQAWATAICC